MESGGDAVSWIAERTKTRPDGYRASKNLSPRRKFGGRKGRVIAISPFVRRVARSIANRCLKRSVTSRRRERFKRETTILLPRVAAKCQRFSRASPIPPHVTLQLCLPRLLFRLSWFLLCEMCRDCKARRERSRWKKWLKWQWMRKRNDLKLPFCGSLVNIYLSFLVVWLSWNEKNLLS